MGANPTKEVQTARRERRQFTDEFKAEGVGLVRSSGKGTPELSRDLDLNDGPVRGWVQRADAQVSSNPGVLPAAELEELSRLLRQVRVLEAEQTILKRAATFCPRRSDGWTSWRLPIVEPCVMTRARPPGSSCDWRSRLVKSLKVLP